VDQLVQDRFHHAYSDEYSGKVLLAGDKSSEDISWGFLIIGLFGGLALFLYGMEKMSEGLKKSTGNQMRSILGTLTKNRVKHLERLRHQRRESFETHSVHLELMDLMKQIIVYSSNID